MKRFITALFTTFTLFGAHAGPIASVDYVHDYIARATNITIPKKATDGASAANLKYLLAVLDKLNANTGSTATNYQTNVLATEVAIPVESVWAAVKKLHNCDAGGYARTDTIDVATGKGASSCSISGPDFGVKLDGLAAGATFSFQMSPKGSFTIDWGDGQVETITKPDTTATTYSHTYAAAGDYTVGFSGQATEYSTTLTQSTISFAQNAHITGLVGDMGKIFPLKPNLNFISTFMAVPNLKSIPNTLFASVNGAPNKYMFAQTFMLSGLQSIPTGLFDGIQGPPADMMFMYTFGGCVALTGSIPD
jgi:hypothetical protein